MAPVALKPLSILVVDDDPTARAIVERYLTSRGYSVDTRMDGEEALQALGTAEYDLVISDIHMAGINGFELLKKARERFPRIGIILMTAYEDTYPLSEALEAGADGYISKPFTLSKFSLIFERAYWNALSRQDWWDDHQADQTAPPETFGY